MEPERPIEKLLHAFAKKRREEAGAPLDLHPATRRLLQSEVARQYGRTAQSQGSRWQTWRQLWPRFAWGLGVLAVLAVAATLLRPSLGHHPSQPTLARNEPLSEAQRIQQAPPAATPAPAPAAAPAQAPQQAPAAGRKLTQQPAAPPAGATPSRDRPRANADKDMAVASDEAVVREKLPTPPPALPDNLKQLEEAKVASVPSLISSNLPTASEPYGRHFGMGGGGSVTSPAAAPTAPRPAAESQAQAQTAITNPPGLTANSAALASWSSQTAASTTDSMRLHLFADTMKANRSIAQAQSFVQAPAEAKAKAYRLDKTAGTKPILDSFQVVQSGQELRVIDRDGSVYVGNFQAAGISPTPSAPATQRPVLSNELQTPQRKLDATSGLANQQAVASYFFRVTGTNQSLKQKVVFTGNLLPATNPAVLPFGTNQVNGSVGGAVMPQATSNLLPLPIFRISGKATIGDRQEIDINATPVKP